MESRSQDSAVRAFGVDFVLLYHDMESRSQDSAVQSTTVLRELIQTTEKWMWKNFFRASRGETVATHLYGTAFGSGRTTPKFLAPAL